MGSDVQLKNRDNTGKIHSGIESETKSFQRATLKYHSRTGNQSQINTNAAVTERSKDLAQKPQDRMENPNANEKRFHRKYVNTHSNNVV